MENNKENTIHDFDFEMICDYFSGFERQGPGSVAMTEKALGFIDNGTQRADYMIADLGCGTGGQTITLARNTAGKIAALDIFPRFLDILEKNAAREGLSDRISTFAGSMSELPFPKNSFDLIWSEGAIYNIGFREGLEYWGGFLKTGGYLAVTEATWLTPERPREIQDFWDAHYPQVDTVAAKVGQMEQAGYTPTACFLLPEECWLVDFYGNAPQKRKDFLLQHPDDKAATEFVSLEEKDERLYRQYSNYYGYVFYIGRKL